MGQRRLEISDLATADESEIIKNPWQFLDLPPNSSPEDTRRAYIHLAKKYHPDLVNPQFDATKLSRLYSQEDIDATKLSFSIDEMMKIAKSIDHEKVGQILDEIRLMAHRKMVLINRAYEEIKARHNPAEWNRLFGYNSEPVFNEHEKEWDKAIELEGRGKLTVYPNHFEYWVAGPYLAFDYGPDNDHPWEDWSYRHEVVLKHLFAHLEIREGKRVSKVLLEPLIDCFRLDKNQADSLVDMLSGQESTESIMERMGIPHENKLNSETNRDAWIKSLKFRRHINEVLTLSREPSWHDGCVVCELKNDKLRLEDYSQVNFSEADYILFLTLAYGPLLINRAKEVSVPTVPLPCQVLYEIS